MLFKLIKKIRVVLFSGILMLGISHAQQADKVTSKLNQKPVGETVTPTTISFHLAQPNSQDPGPPKLIDKNRSCEKDYPMKVRYQPISTSSLEVRRPELVIKFPENRTFGASATGLPVAETSTFEDESAGLFVCLKGESVLDSSSLSHVTVGIDPSSARNSLMFNVKEKDHVAQRRLQEITAKHVNKPMALLYSTGEEPSVLLVSTIGGPLSSHFALTFSDVSKEKLVKLVDEINAGILDDQELTE
jgi:preprotein translocase subunit SecD